MHSRKVRISFFAVFMLGAFSLYSNTLIADGGKPVPKPWIIADGGKPVPKPWAGVAS